MSLANDLQKRAQELGFVASGIGPATPLGEHEVILAERLQAGALAALPWFRPERVPLAARPELLLPGARSVISLAWPYSGQQPPLPKAGICGKVADYACGRDYHQSLKAKLREIVTYLSAREPGCQWRAFVDATPLLERALAQRAGLGWVGRNNCLIVPGQGSRVLLAEVLTTVALEAAQPASGDCGACRACLEACPTGALASPYYHIAGRCLSYLTVELRGPIPAELRPLLGDRVLGCDTCQSVCPQNRCAERRGRQDWAERAVPVSTNRNGHRLPGSPYSLPARLDLRDLFALDEAAFKARFAGTAAARPGRAGLLRNAAVVLGNQGDRAAVPILAAALADTQPLVRGHAAWALGRLGGALARASLEQALSAEGDEWVAREIALALA